MVVPLVPSLPAFDPPPPVRDCPSGRAYALPGATAFLSGDRPWRGGGVMGEGNALPVVEQIRRVSPVEGHCRFPGGWSNPNPTYFICRWCGGLIPLMVFFDLIFFLKVSFNLASLLPQLATPPAPTSSPGNIMPPQRTGHSVA